MDGYTTTAVVLTQESQWRWAIWLAWGVGTWLLLSALPVRATDVQIPWECTGYSGEAQTRCTQTFIELQRKKIAKLEGQLQAQEGIVGQLKEQADRQAAAAADLHRQLADRPSTIQPVPYAYPYAYTYGYPTVGFGLYLGRPWIYGPPYFYRPYWGGPPYFGFRGGHWGHHR